MHEDYQVLGLDETATDEELTARYEELKAKYKEDRWLDGEEGNEAAKKLTRLEMAYAEIVGARKERTQSKEQFSYDDITTLLKDGKTEEAQKALDNCNERGAEWHYLQAVVYYKKNWTNDSKKQLEIAMQMEPSNLKYRTAYNKMTAKNNYQQQSAYADTQNPYVRRQEMDEGNAQMGGSVCSDCITCCYFNLCVNCLFNLCCGCS